MKKVLLIGFAIVLFTTCLNQNKKVMLTTFSVTEFNDYNDQETPMEPAIKKAKDAWENTKSICEILWYQTP